MRAELSCSLSPSSPSHSTRSTSAAGHGHVGATTAVAHNRRHRLALLVSQHHLDCLSHANTSASLPFPSPSPPPLFARHGAAPFLCSALSRARTRSSRVLLPSASIAMSISPSPLDELNPLAALNKLPNPSLLPTSPPSSPAPVEVSDDALLSGPTPTSSSPSHPLAVNGFASAHSHLHPPNLRLHGLSHIEPFLTPPDDAAPPTSNAPTSGSSQPSSPAQISPVSYLSSSAYLPNVSGPSSESTSTGSPVPGPHLTASPSIGTLAAATFAGIRADPSTMTSTGAIPPTPTTSTGYTGTQLATPHQGGHPPPMQMQQNGHPPQFFAPSRPGAPPPLPQGPPPPQQLQLINAAGLGPQPPQYLQQQQQQQQQQQRLSGGASTPASAKSGGFFSKLFKQDTPPRGPIERPPPLPIYMQRLRLTHDWHYKNIHQLADRKKKFEQKHAEEVNQWLAWALYPLASLAHAFYVKNLQHLNALLSLEGKFMDNTIEHITVVNAVCEGKLSEAVIMKDMMSAVGDGSVKAQEEVDAMFWPSDADDTKALCKRLYEETKRLEAQYVEMQAKMKKRDSLEVRRKRVQDWLRKGLSMQDTIKADPFHHHPLDVKTQLQFNQLMLDQRGEEGKLMRRFLDMQTTHRARMQAPAILHFTDYLIASVIKSYTLDERTEPIIRLYAYRLIFPRIPEAVAALITPEERAQCRQLANKIAWLRTLTPQQLGIEEENVPPDFAHDPAYQPLAAPPGSQPDLASPRAAPDERKEPTSATAPAPAPTDGGNSSAPPPPGTPGTPAGAAPASAAPTPFAPSPTSHPELFSPPAQRVEDEAAAPRKMVPDSFPYADAINMLALLSYDVVPFDMFFRVVSAVRLVHQYHKTYTRANREAKARAQARALTYDDPFTSFMTKLVDESNRKADDMDRKDEEERKQRETKEAEVKRQQEAHHRHSNSTGAAAPAPPSPNTTSLPPPAADPALPPLDPPAVSPASNGASDHLPPPASSASANPTPSTVSLGQQASPQKAFDHPLAAHHLAPPPTASSELPFTSPAPVPSLPSPAPPIPERPQEETPLNADQLTPLCVWIVIHANVPSLPARLGQVQRFVREDWRQFGEAGYSYCQVETAAYYLEQLTEATLGQVRAGDDSMHPPGVGEAVHDRVSSPALQVESPSGNMLSPGVGPTHSVSMDGLRRRGTQDDVFADLLTRQTNAELPALEPTAK